MDKVFMPAKLQGVMHAPASKSGAHRSIICAGLTAGETRLTDVVPSEDMAATRRCMTALGASIREDGEGLVICGGSSRKDVLPLLDCGESGSTLRFFVPLALTIAGGAVFRMHGRLGQRPMEVYRDLFVPRGVHWRMGVGADCSAELTVAGRMEAGHYELPGNVSSQFVSGLLFALPLMQGESTLKVLPPVESAGYIRMTLEALRASGIAVKETAPYCWTIPGGQQYRMTGGRISGDYSQAAVFLCAAALGHDVTVAGLEERTTQGDRMILKHLAALGAKVEESEQGIRVLPGKMHGATLDMHNTPDLAPMLALTCQLIPGESRLTGCARLRLKECDRLKETVRLLNALGGMARVDGDDMVITGRETLRGGATVDGCGDHRMVMLAAMAASFCQKPVTVTGAEAVDKSWPDFMDVYKSLGGQAE